MASLTAVSRASNSPAVGRSVLAFTKNPAAVSSLTGRRALSSNTRVGLLCPRLQSWNNNPSSKRTFATTGTMVS